VLIGQRIAEAFTIFAANANPSSPLRVAGDLESNCLGLSGFKSSAQLGKVAPLTFCFQSHIFSLPYLVPNPFFDNPPII